ncbi:CvpA family protein [Acinetobacter sp. c3-l95]|uniref:CvpA family protein n=1 Tax=Acinetobacter sp. c3-l95 TaxID=3342804 RepID=UPI0035BAF52D
MSGLDIFLLIKLSFNAYRGFSNGLVKTITNLIGWFSALVLAVLLHQYIAPSMQAFSHDPKMQTVLAFAAIVLSVMMMSWAVNYLLSGVFKKLKINWLNRIAGGIFGIAKTAVILMILIYILSPWLSGMSWWKNSIVIQLLQPHSAQTAHYSQDLIKKSADTLENQRLDKTNVSQDDIIPKNPKPVQQDKKPADKTAQQSGKMANPFQ